MNELMKQRCVLLEENTKIMKKNFFREYSLMKYLCASIYTNKNKKIEPQKIKDCLKMIKSEKNIPKSFKGLGQIVIATMLSLSDKPEEQFKEVLRIHDKLNDCFEESKFLPMASILMDEITDFTDYTAIAKKAKKMYDEMKKEHPKITSYEDTGFAAMLALSDITEDAAIEEAEECYEVLIKTLIGANPVQSLSHVLALGSEETSKKCEKTKEIVNLLKERKCNFTNGMEQVSLGLLVLLKEKGDILANEVADVYEDIKYRKGFSIFSVTKSQRLMYAVTIVASVYLEEAAKKRKSKDALNIIGGMKGTVILEHIIIACSLASALEASASSAEV